MFLRIRNNIFLFKRYTHFTFRKPVWRVMLKFSYFNLILHEENKHVVAIRNCFRNQKKKTEIVEKALKFH